MDTITSVRPYRRVKENRDKKKHPLYLTWYNMRRRCNNPKNASYAHYGARGIKVCERWQVADNFYSDMPPRPSKAHSIERKNTNGNYEPGNCIWATATEQSLNRRNNRIIEYKGESKTISEWATHLGIKFITLWKRLDRGWPTEQAFSNKIGFSRFH